MEQLDETRIQTIHCGHFPFLLCQRGCMGPNQGRQIHAGRAVFNGQDSEAHVQDRDQTQLGRPE